MGGTMALRKGLAASGLNLTITLRRSQIQFQSIHLHRCIATISSKSLSSPSPSASPLLRSWIPTSTRLFSTSSPSQRSVQGPLPYFPKTSNPKLDELLSYLRMELFVPQHLLDSHRKLIYRPKNHHLLLEEPIYFNISDQPIQLLPKKNTPSLPRSLFTKCLNAMQTPKDYNVIPGLILGYTQADRSVKMSHLEKMARVAGLAGRADVVLQCLDGAAINAFRMNKNVARETMRGFWVQSQLPTFEQAAKALRRGQRLLRYLSNSKVIALGTTRNPIHPDKQGITPEETALRKQQHRELCNDPIVTGVMAGLYADVALRFTPDYTGEIGGVDHSLSTTYCIKKFFLGWPNLETEISQVNTLIADKPIIPTSTNSLSHLWRPPHTFKHREEYNDIKSLAVDYTFLIDSLKKVEQILRNTATVLTIASTYTQATLNDSFNAALTLISSSHPTISPDKILSSDSPPPTLPQDQKAKTLTYLNETLSRLILEITKLEQTLDKWNSWLHTNKDNIHVEWLRKKKELGEDAVEEPKRLGLQSYVEAVDRFLEWMEKDRVEKELKKQGGKEEEDWQDDWQGEAEKDEEMRV